MPYHDFSEMVHTLRDTVKELSIDDLKQWHDNQKHFALIDVREDHEWLQGKLAGARHIGKGIIERDIMHCIPDKNTPLVLYCGGGHRSILAAHALAQLGYAHAYSLAGGFAACQVYGMTIETPATLAD